jgi:hypothetical protein
MKSGAQIAKKWADRLAASKELYEQGIDGVEVAPGVSAVAHEAAMRAHTMEAIDSGKWRENTLAVGLQDWKGKAKGKGGQRLIDGAREARPDREAYYNAMAAEYDKIKKTVRAMPNVTEADKDARQKASQEMMKALRGRGQRKR